MSRLATTFALGYHGCDKAVGLAALKGEVELLPSEKGFDWLGRGVYFWESDQTRAREWAEWKVARGDYAEPFVIGAVIDQGNCLDLTVRDNLELLAYAYTGLKAEHEAAGLALPHNRDLKDDPFQDMLLRFLDYAVIEKVCQDVEEAGTVEPFDTVRGLFQEGDRAYEGSGFFLKTHTQIAVRRPSAIKGVFLPPAPQSRSTA